MRLLVLPVRRRQHFLDQQTEVEVTHWTLIQERLPRFCHVSRCPSPYANHRQPCHPCHELPPEDRHDRQQVVAAAVGLVRSQASAVAAEDLMKMALVEEEEEADQSSRVREGVVEGCCVQALEEAVVGCFVQALGVVEVVEGVVVDC